MTTVYQIIVDAYRQSNLIPIGVAPTQAQEVEALRYLERIINSVLGYEVGENLVPLGLGQQDVDYPFAVDYILTDDTIVLPENTKLMCNLSSAQEVWLHPSPDTGARLAVQDLQGNFATYPLTIHGNGRLISGAKTLTLNTNSTNSEWLYSNTTGNWALVQALTKFSEMPFPSRFDDFFIITLAFRLNPAYERQLDPQSALMLKKASTQLRASYSVVKPVSSELGILRLTGNKDQWSSYSEESFNKGIIF